MKNYLCDKMRKINFVLLSLVLACVILTSCSTGAALYTKSIEYQSIRASFEQPKEIPDDAEIQVTYVITTDGVITPLVKNLTDEILVIDQTKSFFIDTNGTSISYYDPTVKTSTTTDFSSKTSGASVNLGALGSALGIGGKAGSLLSGINVGGSGTDGISTSNMTVFSEQPQTSLGPKGNGVMPKNFSISGVGKRKILNFHNLKNIGDMQNIGQVQELNARYDYDTSHLKFSVCISYSLDGGKTFKKIVNDFYVNSEIIVPVTSKGQVNNALRKLLQNKNDALSEPWYYLYFNNNIDGYDTMAGGRFHFKDYK